MNVRRGNVARSVAAAAIFGLVLFGVLVLFAPDSVALSPNNYGWNGIQGISTAFSVNFTTSLATVPAKAVLVIMQPSTDFSASDVSAVRLHLAGGGSVVVADKSGFANSLLQGLGSGITIESQYLINDATYNWKDKTLPTALVQPGAASRFPFAANVSGMALNQPSPLLLQNKTTAVAATSQLSYEVARQGTTPASKGPFVVAAAERVGKGALVVVSDSQFLLNSEWTIADNRALIGNLLAKSSVYMDASHWTLSPLTSSTAQLKAEFRQLYGQLSGSPGRYAVTVGLVLVALALVPAKEPRGGRPSRSASG